MSALEPIKVHKDPVFFREAITFTAAETSFAARLIEKDYFCSLLLTSLSGAEHAVFKGGTCLAKVHAGFYRLSEDLDFAVSLPVDAKRSVRKKHAEPLRRVVEQAPAPFHVTTPMTGYNNSLQYAGAVSYTSLLDGRDEPILIELSLREPLLLPAVQGQARTVLLDPLSGTPLVPTMPVPCIAQAEAFAEKFRAALSRRDVAIRDFLDLDYAVRNLKLAPSDAAFVTMVQRKLSIPKNEPVNVGAERLVQLRGQVDGRLRPVLRVRDFAAFDLDRAFGIVAGMVGAVGG